MGLLDAGCSPLNPGFPICLGDSFVIRKLFDIKQTTTVQDYVDRFSELVDLLVTYEHTTHPLYITL
jgi:hypothetical protein